MIADCSRLPQSQKEIPVQLLVSAKPLKASIVIASFGSAQGYNAAVFDVEIRTDPTVPAPHYEKPLRYGKKPEIHHIFRADPRSPPKAVSLLFALAVVATVPALFISVSYACQWLAVLYRSVLIRIVALPGCECQPPEQGHRHGTSVTCLVLWFHRGYGIRLLHVLH